MVYKRTLSQRKRKKKRRNCSKIQRKRKKKRRNCSKTLKNHVFLKKNKKKERKTKTCDRKGSKKVKIWFLHQCEEKSLVSIIKGTQVK
jgi:hypothetical protein